MERARMSEGEEAKSGKFSGFKYILFFFLLLFIKLIGVTLANMNIWVSGVGFYVNKICILHRVPSTQSPIFSCHLILGALFSPPPPSL